MKRSRFSKRTLLVTLTCSAVLAFLRYATSDSRVNDIPYYRIPYTHHTRRPVIPRLKRTPQVLGLVSDPALDRDSCGSSKFGDRTLWTCRDTQLFKANGSIQVDPLIDSSASWSDDLWDGSLKLEELAPDADVLSINSTVLNMYGGDIEKQKKQPFFPLLPDECEAPSGKCADGSRYVIWPDVPPMVTKVDSFGTVRAYTWIRKWLINPDSLEKKTPHPETSLYKVEYNPLRAKSSSDLPEVTVVDEQFWDLDEIPYGSYGNVIKNGIAYLYGQVGDNTALAKVPVDFVEDKSKYLYWVKGRWTSTRPTRTTEGVFMVFANAGGQGTYYYSEAWKSFVWIGGGVYANAEFTITTAPSPTGPWIEPIHFYSGVEGNYHLGAYSIQAHPELSGGKKNGWGKARNEVYVTYTINDEDAEGNAVYRTPLVLVEWEDERHWYL